MGDGDTLGDILQRSVLCPAAVVYSKHTIIWKRFSGHWENTPAGLHFVVDHVWAEVRDLTDEQEE